MFVELVDLLRCPRPHEDTWLVAAAEAMSGRHIVRGTLGCPVCEAEYPIRDGVVLEHVEYLNPLAVMEAFAPEPAANES